MESIKNMLGTIGELFSFLWARKLWWLMPMILLLMCFAILIILGSTAGIGPFVYTLF